MTANGILTSNSAVGFLSSEFASTLVGEHSAGCFHSFFLGGMNA